MPINFNQDIPDGFEKYKRKLTMLAIQNHCTPTDLVLLVAEGRAKLLMKDLGVKPDDADLPWGEVENPMGWFEDFTPRQTEYFPNDFDSFPIRMQWHPRVGMLYYFYDVWRLMPETDRPSTLQNCRTSKWMRKSGVYQAPHEEITLRIAQTDHWFITAASIQEMTERWAPFKNPDVQKMIDQREKQYPPHPDLAGRNLFVGVGPTDSLVAAIKAATR